MSKKLAAPILIATTLIATTLAGPTSAWAQSATRRPVMLIHGNYCGPGNNAPLAPIDALDAACARHDACTPDEGLPSKACNRRLQDEAEALANNPGQLPDIRMVAGIVASGAAMMPFHSEDQPNRHASAR